jgi:hypothetical protein
VILWACLFLLLNEPLIFKNLKLEFNGYQYMKRVDSSTGSICLVTQVQFYLNLFVLWHNVRVFELGKRQGKSPYQLAGMDPGTDYWLILLGYPAE